MAEKETEEEISRAFEIFMDPEKNEITFESLQKIAKEIEEDISEEELMEMIMEANNNNVSGRRDFRSDFGSYGGSFRGRDLCHSQTFYSLWALILALC